MQDIMDISSSHLHQHHHHQEMAESMVTSSTHNRNNIQSAGKAAKAAQPPEQALKCPRCESTNTKFCYYNNYSLTQPRYFCKSCRRYWTKGGTLRNVPVGGGCRKSTTKRSSSSGRRMTTTGADQDSQLSMPIMPLTGFLTSSAYDSNDLSLAFARLQKQQYQIGFDEDTTIATNTPTSTSTSTPPGFLEALRSSFLHTAGPNGNFSYNYGDDDQGYSGNNNNNNNNGIMSFQNDQMMGIHKEEYLEESSNSANTNGKGMLWGLLPPNWQMMNYNYGLNQHQYGTITTTTTTDHHHETAGSNANEGSGGWWNSGNINAAGGGGGGLGGGSAANWHNAATGGGLVNTSALM